MTEKNAVQATGPMVQVFESIAILAMALMGLAIIAIAIGHNGLGLNVGPIADDSLMSMDVDIDFPVDFGDRLAWTETEQGTVDAATGRAPVELGGPISATLSFWSPSTIDRTVWVLWKIAGPVLGIAATWLVYGMTKSTRLGDPFSAANERRLWKLAFVIAVGGSAYIALGEVAKSFLVQGSAAEEFIAKSFTFSFAPLVAGLGVAVLASVWHVGVGLREELEGTI